MERWTKMLLSHIHERSRGRTLKSLDDAALKLTLAAQQQILFPWDRGIINERARKSSVQIHKRS
jgi:hypothetical protein